MPHALLIPLAAAAIGGGASIIAGNKASKAQRYASDQNTYLQQQQNAEARRQYDLNRGDLAPYREQGVTSLGQLGRGTVDGGEFNRNFTLADFQKDPGYAFRQQEGERGVEASAAARGGILSGGALKAIARYNQDYASNEYGQAYSRYSNDTTTRYNRLAALAGTGQTAVNSGIDSSGRYIGQLQNGVNNISGNNNAAANARSSQYAATSQAIGGVANSIGGYFGSKSGYQSNPGYRVAPVSGADFARQYGTGGTAYGAI